MPAASRLRPALAAVLFGLVIAETLSAIVGSAVTPMTLTTAVDSFMISNATIGVACAGCGLVIARHRPSHALGWLLLGAGITQAGTAAVTPWLAAALRSGDPDVVVRWWATLYSAAWPWSVSLFIPLAVLVFPDGRLPARAWRPVVGVIAANAVLQVLLFNADPNPLSTVPDLPQGRDGRARSWLSVGLPTAGALDLASELLLSAAFLAGLVGLVVRYRRGDERTRRQLLWLLLASVLATAIVVLERVVVPIGGDGGLPIILTAAIALVPVAMTIAVVRHQLLDIRSVWSRTVTYGLLTAAVAAVYVGLVQLGEHVLRTETGLGTSLLVTLLVAAGFAPVRARLQRLVDRLLYGERSDPVRAVSSVTTQLAAVTDRPAEVLPAVCRALRLPYASVSDAEGLRGEHGDPPEHVEVFRLESAGHRVGELRVGVRTGQRRLDPADRAVLELIAVPIGVAVRADTLAVSLLASRQELVTAREAERRRIRRDLHDGLGPVLTGIAFQADLVVALAATNPERVAAIGRDVRAEVTTALDDVRRLINELRPPALDELGLVEALRRHLRSVDHRVDGAPLAAAVHAREPLGDLPDVVEVAVYRIVTEALVNVARHSCASRVDVGLDVVGANGARELVVTVDDDGAADPSSPWTPGVGLRSMEERTAELRGRVHAAPTPSGGHLVARLPLDVEPSGGRP